MKRLASFCLTLLLVALVAGPAFGSTATVSSTPSLTADLDPMAYCTVQDVKDQYDAEELASLTGDAQRDTIDDQKVQDAVDDFGAYMERHIRMQHPDNPFDQDDLFLNSMNAEGAKLYLQQRAPGDTSEEVRKDLKRLDQKLMAIARGELDLMDQTEIDNAPSDKLNADDLIDENATEFGIHRRLPQYLNA